MTTYAQPTEPETPAVGDIWRDTSSTGAYHSTDRRCIAVGPAVWSTGAAAHTHVASDVAQGVIATARLGSGTADATKYLRGDQSWATPSAEAGPHAASHQPGGTDTMAVDAAAGTGSLRTIGTGAVMASNGTDWFYESTFLM